MQVDFKMLGEEIYRLYTNNGFSKVMKVQIDEIVFHYFLFAKLSEYESGKFIKDGKIQYDSIDKSSIYKLSLDAGLTEAVIQSKIEKDFLAYRNKNDEDKSFDLREFIKEQIKRFELTKNDLVKDGKIRFMVQNPVIKKKFTNALTAENTIIDYSFNRDLIVVSVLDVIDILGFENQQTNSQLQAAIKEHLPKDENKRQEIISSRTVRTTTTNLVKYLGKTAYEKFLDAAFAAIFKVN